MIKRITITIIIIIAIIALGGAFFFSSSGDNTNDKQADKQSKKTSTGNENKEALKLEPSLDKIFDLAKQGKILDRDIIVGETTADDVQKAWGEPDNTDDTDVGLFLNYPSHDIDVGITDNIVSDMRSSQETFKSLDLDTIQTYEKPDDTRYYQDEDHDQIILVYELSNDYVLKWVLPKPADDSDNPDVDHISLSKEISRDGGNGDKGDDSSDINADSMSLDEKIGQMIFSGIDETEMTAETKNIIERYHVGGIILFEKNIESKTQTVNLLNDIKAVNTDNPYPLLLGVDEEGGSVTRMPDGVKSLPTSRSIGELNNSDVSFNVGTLLGEQLQALGFNLDFAPVLDINSNPDNPVIGDRSFGNNPDIVTRLGIQMMKGIQSEGVISVMKHFPGHGDTGEDSHLELPKIDKSYEELSKLELKPFKKAISENADVSMIAHILLPKIDENYPASMSKEVITGILREDYEFDGVVITDDLTMDAITDHYHVADAAIQTVKAGGDLLLVAHDPDLIATVFDELKAAVENGEISEGRIDKSVERITHLKEEYQLLDEMTPVPNFQSINEKVETILQKIS
ncbi:beta-N-acetylhexosaminidase [Lentibacillus halodurans]|uniref:beta-N-acetylhexosaminidase n=1 Tax=Lentibacillus halodurans TaxID=237679 RepID=A0A1I0ZHM3_9BACI|nr:beta-N-acetylhexosaminidase [Lentibacillus halodurans]SFB24040.1 beta-N-acetylhexosaminidase [Lentibacillus halodurans]